MAGDLLKYPAGAAGAWRDPGRIAPVLVALAATTACAILYRDALVPAGGFQFDEAAHAVYGLRQARHLRLGELLEFARENLHMGAWPFLHSWMLAIGYLLGGGTIVTARAVSLACFFVFVLVLYRFAAAAAPRAGWLAGSIAAAMALTSPILLLFACRAMLEVPALLIGWAALYAQLRAQLRDDTGISWGAAALAVLTFYTRYDYGLYVMATILSLEAFDIVAVLTSGMSRSEKRQRMLSRFLNVGILGAVFQMSWVLWAHYHAGFGRYLDSTWNSHVHAPLVARSVSINSTWLTYYPISIARDYTASIPLAVLTAIAAAAAVARLRDRRRLLCVVLFCTGMPLVFFHVPLDPASIWFPFLEHARFQMMIVPALWVLASTQLAEWLAGTPERRGWASAARFAVGAGLIVMLAGGAGHVYGAIRRGEYAKRVGQAEPRECLDTLGDTIMHAGADARVYIVDDISSIPPGVVEWELRRRASDRTVIDIAWPAWPADPADGYERRLQALLMRSRSNWVITTERFEREHGRVHDKGYIRAMEAMPNARRIAECTHKGSFTMKVYAVAPAA